MFDGIPDNASAMARKPRLVIVGPVPPSVGGVETVTRAVLDSQITERFDVCHCDITKHRPKETAGRWDVGNLIWAAIHFLRMARICRRFRPHLVYLPLTGTWTGFSRDSLLAFIGKWYGAKVVGHVHGAWFYRVLSAQGTVAHAVRYCLTRFDALLVLGSWWKGLVERYGYAGQVYTVPPTLSRDLYDVGQAHRTQYETEPVGLFVGSVGKRKGVFDLLDALHVLRERHGTRVRMVIVGGQEERGEWRALHDRCAVLGLCDTVEFKGPLQGQSLYQHFRQAGFFVLPSYAEGLPVSILEAGCFGLAVITTPVGAICDLIRHGENGILIEPGDVNALAHAIARLHGSATERYRLGTELKRQVGSYHPKAVCLRIEECLGRVFPNNTHATLNPPVVRR